MTETLSLALALAAGLVLGAMFFGGLWWTVLRGVSSSNPALWFICRLLLRSSIALTGFYLVGNEHWERLLVCLLGFIVARFIVTRLTRLPTEHHAIRADEVSHASHA
jgi:F1F0 ATPase subunit 2